MIFLFCFSFFSLTVSNFFDTDEKIAVGVDVLDTEAMDHVMKQWRAEAHKMM